MTVTADPPVTSPPDLSARLVLGAGEELVRDFRHRVRAVIDSRLRALLPAAERERRFPREAVSVLGRSALYAERWSGGRHGDLGRSLILAEEMGRAGLGGIAVGVALHFEAAVGLLRLFARSDHTRSVLHRALTGDLIACIASSERDAGSDMSAVATRLRPAGNGWHVTGTKWFVSPGGAADVVIVLCRAEQGLALVVVPRDGFRVVHAVQSAGVRSLQTARLAIDAHVGEEAVLVRPGMGLPALTSGLLFERFAIAAHVLGTADLAVTLATTHLHRRRQFGVPLYQHQALRLRLADLAAQVSSAQRAQYAAAAEMGHRGALRMYDVAALKVTATRLGEHVVTECMHLFGGHGYVEDETPLAMLWRDLRVARVGGGSDEMMWEVVARGLRRDDDLYDTWIST